MAYSDNLNYSASPNLAIVNAGVYDLEPGEATDWITRDVKDKSFVKKISPLIIIHGTDGSFIR